MAQRGKIGQGNYINSLNPLPNQASENPRVGGSIPSPATRDFGGFGQFTQINKLVRVR